MPDKAGHAVLRHLAESNQDSTLAVCGACTRRKPYKTAALSEVFSSLVSVPFYVERERVFVCTSTTGGELVSLRIFSKPANLS